MSKSTQPPVSEKLLDEIRSALGGAASRLHPGPAPACGWDEKPGPFRPKCGAELERHADDGACPEIVEPL
jgi:hypothetical protein